MSRVTSLVFIFMLFLKVKKSLRTLLIFRIYNCIKITLMQQLLTFKY
nr:MAG TPA: hypothetical protein [Caudoviricetes sp.]